MFKGLFLYIILTCSAVWALSQNNFQPMTSPLSSTEDSWDLKLQQYVWSYTHPVSLKVSRPVMSFNDIENIVTIGQDADVSISPDGNYFTYGIQNAYWSGHGRVRDSLIVQAIRRDWRRAFPASAKPGFFSRDSKQYIFQQNEDLFFLSIGMDKSHIAKGISSYIQNKGEWLAYLTKDKELVIESLIGTEKEKRFENVSSYQFDMTGQWIVCWLNTELRELLFYNVTNGKKYHFQGVDGYEVQEGGKSLLVYVRVKTDNGIHSQLQYFNFSDEVPIAIWSTTEAPTKMTSYVFDNTGTQVAFVTHDSSDLSKSALWYWNIGMDKAVLKVNRQTPGMESDWIIQEACFTDNNQYILFFSQQKPIDYQPRTDVVGLDVWSYKDTLLPSAQQFLISQNQGKKYSAVIATEGNRVVKIVKDYYEWIRVLGFPSGDYAVVEKAGKRVNIPNEPNFVGDRFWDKKYESDSTWLVSLKDGARSLIKTGGEWVEGTVRFSPKGKYLLYFDGKKQCNYFSIDLTTGKRTNISPGIPAFQLGRQDYYYHTSERPQRYIGIAGWLQGDSGVLVYDNYDIWKLDMSGSKSPVNITNGFGRLNDIRFSLIANGEEGHYVSEYIGMPILPCDVPLLLNSFNMKTKYSGVYRIVLGKRVNPEMLWTGPYMLEKVPATTLNVPYLLSNGINIFKAAAADVWIVKRQGISEAPNYFLTTDFKRYEPLTDIQPHKGFNWLTAELHTFKQMDGFSSQGILYKPENFDPTKKYPVLIVIYDQFTKNLFKFPIPDYVWSPIAPGFSPMLLLNNGYLIFLPNICVTPLKYGPSALSGIEGAVKYLKQLLYVDSNHLGAAAHSWSAKLGAYVFTHSHALAAMAISEGFVYADMINMALSIKQFDGSSNLEDVEKGFEFGNLWKNKSTWLDQTTVLNVDKATSPLLLYCGKRSSNDYQDQTVQFFLALRRLEKKAWWLQYETGEHTLFNNDAKDYTIRYMQFFDHYLKGAPAPKWMTQGIPARLKHIETGYELDPMGNCGKDCIICRKWNQKYKNKLF